jgi:hypothetical protein
MARNAAAQIATEDRVAAALRLRRSGASFRSIGDALAVSHVHARRLVEAAFARVATPNAGELRAVELSQLDDLDRALRPRCANGDPAAVSAAVRVSESRRRLLGLDAASPLQVNVTTQSSTITRDTQYAEMSTKLAVAEALAEIDAETVAQLAIEA